MTLAVEIDNLGIAPLAGVCSYERAARAGLDVERTVLRLKRFNYVSRRLNEIAAAHLPRTPEWEVKCALALHMWLDAEHCTTIRARVAEMREPPLQLDDVPDARLEAALEELLRADDTVELLAGIHGVVRPALAAALEAHVEVLNPLFDHPTYRLLRTLAREQAEMVEWGAGALRALTAAPEAAARASAFADRIERYLAAAAGLSGEDEIDDGDGELPAPRWDGSAYVMDATPRRDARFVDPLNGTLDRDAVYFDATRPADERIYALAYGRLGEMDVPEWMAPIVFKTRGKPWDYYRDMSRQLWDETRHAMMGEVALVAAGVPFYAYPIDMTTSITLNRDFTPLEAHVLLWYIEQGLMRRETGKRFEWEIARLDGDPFLVALQDYDWADEVLHAQIGRRWLESELDAPARKQLGAQLMERWDPLRAELHDGSSQAEWWPEFIAQVRAGRR